MCRIAHQLQQLKIAEICAKPAEKDEFLRLYSMAAELIWQVEEESNHTQP